MKSRFSPAFALPTILISSVVMLIVLLLAIQSTISVSEGIRGQYADKLGSEAAESGVALAKACIAQNGTITWTNTKPLKPNTDCTGTETFSCPITSSNPACYLLDEGLYQSTFTVGVIYDTGNNPTDINAQGIVREVRKTNGAVIKQNTQTQLVNTALIGGMVEAIADVTLDAGTDFTCRSITGSGYCWGLGTSGQIGDNFNVTRYVPVPVSTSGVLAGKTVKSVSSGGGHTCIVASDNNAYCWGMNAYGQLGNGNYAQAGGPVAVSTSGVLAGKTIKSVTTGANHSCAVASDNNAYCWGINSTSGYLGNNSTAESTVPVPVSTSGVLAGKTIKAIGAGQTHTCAIASDNNAYCWGHNVYGQLGNNSTTASLVPVAVSTSGVLAGKTVKSISVGSSYTCAIASDNNAYCWGQNSGKLGDNSTTNSSVPVAVSTSGVLAGKTIKAITAGTSHTCAIASDDNAYCWGIGTSGRLGNASTGTALAPVAVVTSGALAGKTVTSISAGASHTCITASDSRAYCWGAGNNGQIGDGNTAIRDTPTLVSNP